MKMVRIQFIVACASLLTMLPPPTFADLAADNALGKRLETSRQQLSGDAKTSVLGGADFGTDDWKPARIEAVLSPLEPDRVSNRGLAEARLYASVAPGVVLVATNDSIGSGTVIRDDGLILTNLHVVGNNNPVAIIFKPHVEGADISKADVHRGTVVRRDQIADLALILVVDAPRDLKVIPLASMTDISVGSDVHAIGHPTGEAWTYTKGIVSQVRRNYEWSADDGIAHKANVIQTQTPINPGNSDGPLLTDAGALVGVNSFKSQGEALNFAVSVEDVRVLLASSKDRLLKPSVRRGACKPKSYGVSRLPDNSGTQELLDIDCFGKPDAILVVPDAAGEPARLELDTEHNGRISGILFSNRRNGKWDYSIWDTTGSGKADLQCVHADGGAKPTRCEKMASG